jgi:flavodoxin
MAMKPLVIYHSRGGKTRKVADAISQELGCASINLEKESPILTGVDLLIVGSGNYGGNVGTNMKNFLSNLQPSNGGKTAVFATSGGPEPKCLQVMRSAVESKGYTVVSTFKCRGQFFIFNRGRPNEDDLKNAKVFANDLKQRVGE